MKLGKKPAVEDRRDLKLSTYLNKQLLPKPPRYFGHEKLVRAWSMLGNDQYGDCVWAGSAHEVMVQNAAAGRHVDFVDVDVLADYSAVTGFDPGDPSSDQGTDTRDAARYRQRTGILDAGNRRHKIGAYVWLQPGNYDELLQALFIFGTVGIGARFPGSAMDQFNRGRPWTYVKGSSIEGGHYFPAVGRRAMTRVVTWGRLQNMTKAWYEEYCDEALVYVSADQLTQAHLTPEGFDQATLLSDLNAI